MSQAEQNNTYRTDSFEKDFNKKTFTTADFLVDKILSCPHNKI